MLASPATDVAARPKMKLLDPSLLGIEVAKEQHEERCIASWSGGLMGFAPRPWRRSLRRTPRCMDGRSNAPSHGPRRGSQVQQSDRADAAGHRAVLPGCGYRYRWPREVFPATARSLPHRQSAAPGRDGRSAGRRSHLPFAVDRGESERCLPLGYADDC